MSFISGWGGGGRERETTCMSDRLRNCKECGGEGQAYFHLTTIRNRPFNMGEVASEMAQSLFGVHRMVHLG